MIVRSRSVPLGTKCCPHCGQTLPRDFLWVGSDRGIALSGLQRQILERVTKAGQNGIHAERLFDFLYDHRADGGPSFKSLAVVVRHLNAKLRPVGKAVLAGRGQRYYRVVSVK